MKRQRTISEEQEEDIEEIYSFANLIPEMYGLVCSFLSVHERSALALTCSSEYAKFPGDKSQLFMSCILQLTQHGNFTGAVEMASDFYHPTLRRWVHESQSIKWSLDDSTDEEDNTRVSPILISTYFETQCRKYYPPTSFNDNPYMCFGRVGQVNENEYHLTDKAFARKLLKAKYHGLIPLLGVIGST